jgi:hypothetical protein
VAAITASVGDVTEERDFLTHVRGQRGFASTKQDIGLDADLAQLLHRVLRGLGLHLARGLDERHQRDMHE